MKKIERMRPQDEMPQVFWDNRFNDAWLRLALYAEIFRCEDEGQGDSLWVDYLKEALALLKKKHYETLDRKIKEMAAYLKVTIKESIVEIC